MGHDCDEPGRVPVVSGVRRLDREALPALKVAFNDNNTQRLSIAKGGMH